VDMNRVIRNHKWKKGRRGNGHTQKENQWFTKQNDDNPVY